MSGRTGESEAAYLVHNRSNDPADPPGSPPPMSATLAPTERADSHARCRTGERGVYVAVAWVFSRSQILVAFALPNAPGCFDMLRPVPPAEILRDAIWHCIGRTAFRMGAQREETAEDDRDRIRLLLEHQRCLPLGLYPYLDMFSSSLSCTSLIAISYAFAR